MQNRQRMTGHVRFTAAREIAFVLISLVGGACASTAPGARPHDMSVRDHDRAAKAHDEAATSLPAQCAQRQTPAPCWKSLDHEQLDEHRRVAAQHRAASAVLRDAENQACTGISDEDRDTSPFERVEDISRVADLFETPPVYTKVAPPRRAVGVVVTFRAVPGLTAEWLQRLVDCHLARSAALGHVLPEMHDCPLVPRGASALARSVGNGFAVEIRGSDEAAVDEIRARGQRLRERASR